MSEWTPNMSITTFNVNESNTIKKQRLADCIKKSESTKYILGDSLQTINHN